MHSSNMTGKRREGRPGYGLGPSSSSCGSLAAQAAGPGSSSRSRAATIAARSSGDGSGLISSSTGAD